MPAGWLVKVPFFIGSKMLPSKDKQLEIVEKITKILVQEWPKHQPRWDLERKGFNYIKSVQYSPELESYYKAQRRPTYVFNAIFEKFNHVLGDHFLGDQKQKVYRKPGGTQEAADLWTDILDHVHTDNNYRYELGRTVLEGWINQGFIYPRYSDEKQIDGSLVYRNEDGFLIMYDSRARDYFLDDAKYVDRMRYMAASDVLKQLERGTWSAKRSDLEELLKEVAKDEHIWADNDWQLDNFTNPYFQNIKNGQYLVVEHFEIVWDYAEVIVDPFTQEANIIDVKDPERRDMLIKDARASSKRIVERKERVKKVTTILPALSFFLHEKDCDTQDGTYDIIPYSPYPYGTKTIENFGMMQVVCGPQDFLNDMQNRTLDIMNKSANAGLKIVREAFENPEDAKRSGQPGIVLWEKAEWAMKGIKTYERFDPPKMPMDSYQMAQEAKYFIDIVTSTQELSGRDEEKNAPASKYAQKIAQGQITLAVPTYTLNMVKSRLDNKLIRLGQANYNTERTFLMRDNATGQQKELRINIPYMGKILNNVQVGEYEVVIDNTSQNPLSKAVRSEQKMAFIRDVLMPLFGPSTAFIPDWDELLINSDMGDMKKWAENVKNVIAQMTGAQEQQAALDKMNALIDTGTKLANAGESPALNKQATGRPVNSPSTQ